MDVLQVRRRTKELSLYVADLILSNSGRASLHPELLCVTSIFFVLKLESDFPASLADFLDYVLNGLKISLRLIREMEYYILLNLPDFFGRLSTFSDFIYTALEGTSFDSVALTAELADLYEHYVNTFINFRTNVNLLDHCVKRLDSATTFFRSQACLSPVDHPLADSSPSVRLDATCPTTKCGMRKKRSKRVTHGRSR